MNSLTLQSPAKLNFYLKIINKREDGYHNISTIFERINLCDCIYVCSNPTDKIKIKCSNLNVPVGKKNLVYKVAQLLKHDFNIKKGIDVKIKKNIPVAAGLAGGSSNAATMLLALNKIWNLRLDETKLLLYAKKIGSDVAFFINDVSWAHGKGRGDIIKKIYNKNIIYHILVIPRIKMYSRKVYANFKMQLTKKGDNASILIHNLKKNNVAQIYGLLFNDLEKVVLKLAPNLIKLIKQLKLLGFKGVMISGSGPAVFGIAANEKHAKQAQSILKKRYSQVFVVKTL